MQRSAVDPGEALAVARVWLAVVALLALLGLGAAAVVLLRSYLVTEVVAVPSLIDLPVSQATERLVALGLHAERFDEADPTAPPEVVLSQSPSAGAEVRPGRAVALGVNPSQMRIVPDLVGMREREALSRIEVAGLRVRSIVYAASDLPVGSVTAQDPLPQAAALAGDALLLLVSRGPDTAPVIAPDLRGMSVDDAFALLASLGVRRVERLPIPVSGVEPGTVTDQRPLPGATVSLTTPFALVHAVAGTGVVQVPALAGLPVDQATEALAAVGLARGALRFVDDPAFPPGVVATLPAGTTLAGTPVALVVNEAGAEAIVATEPVAPPSGATVEPTAADAVAADVPAPGTTRVEQDGARVIPFRFDPAEVGIGSLMRDPYLLQLVVFDAEGERVVYDERLGPGQKVEIPMRVVGDEPLVQTFINGSFFQAWRP